MLLFVTLELFELKLRPVGGETVTSRKQRTLTIKKLCQGFEQTAKETLFKAGAKNAFCIILRTKPVEFYIL